MSGWSAKDEADIASEQESYALQEALWRTSRLDRMQVRGECYNCSGSCIGLFCDALCRADYEHRTRIERKQRGEARHTKGEHAQ